MGEFVVAIRASILLGNNLHL